VECVPPEKVRDFERSQKSSLVKKREESSPLRILGKDSLSPENVFPRGVKSFSPCYIGINPPNGGRKSMLSGKTRELEF